MIDWKRYAPLALRVAIGAGLIQHGGIKLFAHGGHANIAHLVGQLGVPFPDLMGWVTGVVEFGGGLGMLLGVFFKASTIANILNIGGLLVLGGLRGGVPAPLPGGDPLPELREAFLIFAGVLSMLMSGPGRLALRDRFHKNQP